MVPVGYLSGTCRLLVKSYLNTCDLGSLSDTVGYLSDTCRILVKSYLNTCKLGSLSGTVGYLLDTCRIPVGYLSDTCYKWTKHHTRGIIVSRDITNIQVSHNITLYHIISHLAGN